MLLPHLAGLRVEQVLRRGPTVRIHASVIAPAAACPDCASRSARVHSRYQRSVADAAIGGAETVICLRVRRFFCNDAACPRTTFAEQVPGLSTPYARRTPLLRTTLEWIALAAGGRPGQRLTRRLTVAVSRMTLLRLIRALPLAEPGAVTALGVDDFAFRRGHTYGTILIDMDTHRPIDVLPDRLGDTFADWLRAHPGAAVICRDRASGYAEGARVGAPDAIQVADRFHLLYNLTDAVKRVVRAHQKCLRDRPAADAVAQPDPLQPAAPDTAVDAATTVAADAAADAAADVVEGRRAELTRQRWAEVHALSNNGIGTTAISKALNLDTKTVRRYTRAATADELLTTVPRRSSDLDAHTAYLAQRWQEGCTNAVRLAAEVRDRGYRGSERSVRRLLQAWRAGATPVANMPTSTPTPHEVTGWIIHPAEERTEHDHTALTRIMDRCPVLHAVDQLVGDFGGMLRQLRGQHLDTWIAQAQASEIPHIQGFANGLLKDYDAVRNGLTLPWSSGTVEGAVAKLKAVKRGMYGRANFDLLRRRVLLAA